MSVPTLDDYLRPGLALLSVGLNPSLPSARAGFYFANPRNRFWRALNGSGLVPSTLVPGRAAVSYLFEDYGIGFTDVVKRPTAGSAGLRAADYKAGAPLLYDKLIRFRPCIAWFHGKLACQQFVRHGLGAGHTVLWGLQPWTVGGSRVVVTPNPSPANAAFSLDDLIVWYARLADLRDRLCG